MPYSPYKNFFNTKKKYYIFYDSRAVTFDDMSLPKDHSYSPFDFKILEESLIGSVTVELANFNQSTMLDNIPAEMFANICTRKIPPQETFNYLSKFFSEHLTIGVMNKIYDLALSDSFSNSSPQAHYIYFCNWVKTLLHKPTKFCEEYCDLQETYSFYYEPRKIELFISFENNVFNSIYATPDYRTLIYFDIGKIVENKILIKKCENCGKYFIPQMRSNEIYCTNIFKDSKTCRQIGYDNKIKSNEFMNAYRSAYKTQHARIKYNSNNPDYEKQHVIPWVRSAKEAMNIFSSQNDIQGFRDWLLKNRDAF